MPNKYDISSYNYHLSLKMNQTMWAIIIFLIRPYLVVIFSVVNRSDMMGLINMVYVDRLSMSLSAFSALPVVLLIFAFIQRKPDATDLVKRVWANGRHLLAITAALHAVILSSPLWIQTDAHMNNVMWAQLILSIGGFAVTYSSPYINDCFNDFPEDSASEKGGKKNDA